MIQGDETLFECLVIQIKNMKPSWERVEQIDYLIHILDTRNFLGRAMQAWPFLGFRNAFSGSFCYPEASEEYIKHNYWTYWNGHGWEHIWKRFLIEAGLHYDEMTPKAKEHFAIFDTKEKYGTLRISLSGYDDKLFELESIAEELSSVTCMRCGKQPYDSKGNNLIWVTTGWVMTLCKDCLRNDYYGIGTGRYKKKPKDEYKKSKIRFRDYARERRTVVPFFRVHSWGQGKEKMTFRRPAYDWLETYKVEQVWTDE